MQQLDLCRPCAELMRDLFALTTVKTGVNMKVTCARCKKRRYGAVYVVAAKKAGGMGDV